MACACAGAKQCRAGCETTGCEADQFCGANHRCQAKPCSADPECPVTFTCQAGACARTHCQTDSGCPGGFCVLGSCYQSHGECRYPVG